MVTFDKLFLALLAPAAGLAQTEPRRGLGLALRLEDPAKAAAAAFKACAESKCLTSNTLEDMEVSCEDQYSQFICLKQLHGARTCVVKCKSCGAAAQRDSPPPLACALSRQRPAPLHAH